MNLSRIPNRTLGARLAILLAATLGLCLAVAAFAAPADAPPDAPSIFTKPNWSGPDAIAAVERADLKAELRPLLERARAPGDPGRDLDLLQALKALQERSDLAVPAQERILFDFAQGLGDLPPGAVGPEVIDYLLSYRPRTQVPHPDNPRVGTPLYNVRGATAGALNAWQRELGFEAGSSLLDAGGSDAASRYVEAVRLAQLPRRRGLLEALPAASPQQLAEIAALTSADTIEPDGQAVAEAAGMDALAARTALLLDDASALRRALSAARGPEPASLLATAARELDEPGRIDLLLGLLETATPGTAALAVGTLAPDLLGRPEVTDRLFGLLADVDLGAACALVLSAAGQPEIHERLVRIAGDDGLAAKRAALALQMQAQSRSGGAP